MTLSVLSQLALPADALAALRKQGFVSKEERPGRTVFKLRYRLDGVQCVKSLGQNTTLAQLVANELARLQSPRRQARQYRLLARGTRRKLRAVKREFAVLAGAQGLRFHGRQLRHTRGRATTEKTQFQKS